MILGTVRKYPLLVAVLHSLHVNYFYYDSNYTMKYILEGTQLFFFIVFLNIDEWSCLYLFFKESVKYSRGTPYD